MINFTMRGIAASVMLVLATASSSHAVCSQGALQSKIQRSKYLQAEAVSLANQQNAANQRGDNEEYCRLGREYLSMNRMDNHLQAEIADCFAALGHPLELEYSEYGRMAKMEALHKQICG